MLNAGWALLPVKRQEMTDWVFVSREVASPVGGGSSLAFDMAQN